MTSAFGCAPLFSLDGFVCCSGLGRVVVVRFALCWGVVFGRLRCYG